MDLKEAIEMAKQASAPKLTLADAIQMAKQAADANIVVNQKEQITPTPAASAAVGSPAVPAGALNLLEANAEKAELDAAPAIQQGFPEAAKTASQEDGLTRMDAAKRMGAGGGAMGAAAGAIGGGIAGAMSGKGPAGVALGIGGGALLGGAKSGISNGVLGGLIGKGVKGDTNSEIASNMGRRYGNVLGTLGAGVGAATGGIMGAAAKGPLGAAAGAAIGAAVEGGLMYGVGRLGGWTQASVGGAVMGNKKTAKENDNMNGVSTDELTLAKVAAEQLYTNAMEEAQEKIAFAQALFNEAIDAEKTAFATKVAQDNGPALTVPYIDQVKTPAGAAALGMGAGVGGVLGYMQNPNAAGAVGGAVLGAGAVAGAGALKAFIDQHRMARAQEHAAQMGNLPGQCQG